ncbi:TcfC E-set like domain-containing protein [Aliivibrio sifiae]|uniref:TcfC E-set like domain-containing protein n=1 Tax=Aliivibrio sifiae TaxID=566293 RepID=UPI003D11FA27
MKIYAVIFAVFTCVITAAHGGTLPEGFESFYQEEIREVQVKDLNGYFHLIPMTVTYNSVKLSNDEAKKTLINLLTDSGVESHLTKNIVQQYSVGISNTVKCSGDLNLCQLSPVEFDSFYDYHSNKLYIYINNELIKNEEVSTNKEYASTFNENNGFINNVNLYASTIFNGDVDYSMSDQFIVSLPYGNLHFDGYLSNESESNELREAYYNLDFNDVKMTTGYTKDRLSKNTTDFLMTGMQYNEFSLSVSSSNLLTKENGKTDKKLYFYSPKQGVLKVYRDDRVLLQRNVSEGQDTISYSELPTGVYNIRIEISIGEQIVFNEQQRVYNSNNNTLNINDFDYLFTAGFFDGDDYELYENKCFCDLDNDPNRNEFDDQAFLNGVLTYQLSPEVLFGFGGLYSQKHYMIQTGFSVYLPFDGLLDSSVSLINDNEMSLSSYYFSSNVNFGSFSINYEKLYNAQNSSLARYVYDEQSNEQLTLSNSYNLSRNTFGYTTVSYIERESDRNYSGFKSWYFTTGFTHPFIIDSILDVNLSLSGNDNDIESMVDDFSLSLTWSIPLSDSLTGKTSSSFNKSGLTQYSNSIETSDLLEDSQDSNLNMIATNTYISGVENNSQNDLSVYGNHRNDKFTADTFGYMNDNGGKGANISLSSTQVATTDALYFTSTQSDSYAIVDTNSRVRFNEKETNNKGLLLTKTDGKLKNKQIIYNDNIILPIDSYSETSIELDTDSVSLHNEGQRITTGFTHPGTILSLDSDVTRIISFVGKFKDIFENNINNLTCSGSGCVKEENIAEGIFKVDVQEGLAFNLNSKSLTCMIPSVDNTNNFNFGSNYCLPNIEPNSSITLHNGDNKLEVLYVGAFNNVEHINKKLSLISDDELNVVNKQIGNNKFVYLILDEEQSLSIAQEKLVTELSLYAIRMNKSDKSYVLSRPTGESNEKI